MDNTPYKGMVNTSSQFHLHHQEWMNSNSAMAAAGTAAKIEVVDEDDGGGGGGGGEKSVIEREHMFDKVVTPSDVGKLNRLVIPKQHAEKYFPLDSTNNEKGLLLNFEDRTGKPWRFRYSYWNSSQSYVMTKGWSRFVKEKKLDAGDIVSFQRGVGEVGRDKLFIDWRRRPDGSSNFHHQSHHHPYGRTVLPAALAAGWSSSGSNPNFVLRSHPYPYGGGGGAVWDQHHQHGAPHLASMSLMNVLPSQSHPLRRGGGGAGMGTGMSLGLGTGYGYGSVVNPYPVTGPLFLVRSSSSAASVSNSVVPVMQNNVSVTSSSASDGGGGEGGVIGGSIRMQVQRGECGDEPMVFESVPVVQGKAAAKRLRLFGVNMDCPISHQTHDFDILSSSLASSSSPNHHHHHLNHHHHHHHHDHHDQQHGISSISIMGPPPLPLHPHSPSSSSFSSSPGQQQQYPHPHSQSSSRSFYNGSNSPIDKGKSSSMSLDLDI